MQHPIGANNIYPNLLTNCNFTPMIWAASKRYTPKQGDTKTTVHYAWFPRRIGDNIIWLTQYERLMAWQITQVHALVGTEIKLFEIGKWVKATEIVVKWTRA